MSAEKAVNCTVEFCRFHQGASQHTLRAPGTGATDLVREHLVTGLAELPTSISPRATKVQNPHAWPDATGLKHLDVGGA